MGNYSYRMRKDRDSRMDRATESIYNKPWIMQRADPYVYRHTDGTYYFTASIPAYDGIVLRRADSLKGLAEAPEKVIWHKHESGIMSCHIWAPELHYINGGWYIYYAGGDKDDVWEIRPYVLECLDEDPMTGTWVEKGKMKRAGEDEFSFEAFSLDGTVFENKGKWYYIWAEKVGVGKQISNLYIARMASPCELETVQVLLTTPDYDWERVGFWVNEGPAVIKREGKIFMTYSASETGVAYWMRMRICWIRCPGVKNGIRCWDRMRRPVSMAPATTALRWMKKDMISWSIMPGRRRRSKEIRFTIRTDMRC